MGCKYACVCSGNCLRCNSYEEETYTGEAEDVYSESTGDLVLYVKEE